MKFALHITASSTIIALGIATTGCTATSAYMHPSVPGHPIAATVGNATVVFVRPSGYAYALKTTILDEHGSFLGDSLPKSQFSVTLPAGRHLFVSWAENTGALQADLAPGKVYFVEVAPTIGVLSARVALLALTPRSKSWPKLEEWLSKSTQYDPDTTAGQAYLAERQDDVRERLRRANEAIRGYDGDELARRTLSPGDGR